MRLLAAVCVAALLAGVPALAVPALSAPAPVPTPAVQPVSHPAIQLVAHNVRTDRAETIDQALKIESLKAEVDIAGHMAQTTLTITFANPTEDRLEGDLTIALPLGASVTAYALDVDGVMTDGVLMPRLKAKEAYEENLRHGVDPGLGEVSGNSFRTHVFPILPGSGRTVRIVYTAPVGPDGRLVLPLATLEAPGAGSVSIIAHDMTPQAGMPDLGASIMRPDIGRMPGAQKGDYVDILPLPAGVPMRDVVITGIKPAHDVAISRHSNGERFFELTVAAEPAGAVKAKSVRLYWDASRSRRDQDLAAEKQLVADYVAKATPPSLDIVLFADEDPKVVHLDSPTAQSVLDMLNATAYAGATRFTALDGAVKGHADVCLVASDGQMTMGAFSVRHWPCRVMTLSSAPDARRDVLRQLAARNGGVYVDLAALGHDDALNLMLRRAPKLWDVTDGNGDSVDYTISPLGGDLYRVVGPAPRGDTLGLEYGTISQDFDLHGLTLAANDGAGAVWGQSLIDELNASDAPDSDKVLALARRYHVATPDVSFIVLESGGDYARAGIEPPANAPKNILDDYKAARDELAAKKAEARAERLDSITEQWDDQKAWWDSKPVTLAEAKKAMAAERKADGRDRDTAMPSPPPMVQPRVAAPAEVAPPVTMAARPVPREERVESSDVGAMPDSSMAESLQRIPADEDMVLVTGVRAARRPLGEPEIQVEAAQWNPDRPYLKALEGVKPGDQAAFDAVFTAQEKLSGDTPAFYFDVAEWMYRNGFAAGAAAMARNAADVKDADVDTRIILAGRLLRYGAWDDAIWLDESIARETPDKPQAARNLALALIEATDARLKARSISQDDAVDAYERALGLLCGVVLNTWNDDYDGIEIISLMEANHLVARLKAMDVPAEDLAEILPAKLTALLDVDIRITLEWNTDKTDMDLWVDEPSGERAIYNHPKTMLGGRLSNDQTRGYGPEEYLLRYAPKGGYAVLVNVYAADVINRNGASSVTVHLYRNWGRPDEKVESFVIELKKDAKGAVPVGKFTRE